MRGRPRNLFPEVTDRQREVARLVASGYTNEQIARELGISLDGAKYHVSELLGRLGLERREEIAAWYRSEQGTPITRARRRLRAMGPMPAVAFAGAAGVVAVLALFFVAFEGARGGGGASDDALPAAPIVLERPPPESVALAELSQTHSDGGWTSSAVDDLPDRDLLFLGYWPSGSPSIRILDRASGEWVGEIDGARAPLLAHHPSEDLLLVSARLWGPAAPEPQLLTFDIAGALVPGTAVQSSFPSASGGGFIAPEMGALTRSADGRYLYHLGFAELGSGESGGVVEVLDLAEDAQIVGSLELPGNCTSGNVSLYPHGPSSVILTCRAAPDRAGASGILQVIATDGSAGAPIEAEGLAGMMEDLDDWPVPIAAAVEAPDGIGILYFDGTYAVANDVGVSVVGRALPEGRWVLPEWASSVLSLDPDRIVIPDWKDREVPPGSAIPSGGFVIFNMETRTIEQEFVIDHHGTYPLNEHEVAIVGDGRLDILDLRSSTITQAFDTRHPENPDALPSVR